ncbi:MBL fold metallo-hydrolase [Micromonospora endophytica]|uniref:MBL fold metallo-hydrolase n=1 Tax=Micromonospora endophytica TaxID=515350 RepID=UPI001BB37FB9|nr:MBL fold metallo-hydrolase [Micromonospora endophytica]BCJ61880.1 MBL fold metallo-hydrolase [Micromonospora endophytica]
MPGSDRTGPPAAARITEVADRVYAYLQPDGGWCLNNAGVVTAPGFGAVVVDTAATERRARALRTAVDAVADGPRRIIVNTHFHGDHTFGNAVFGPAATVVSHAGTRAEIAETGLALTGLWPNVDWGEVRTVLPHLTYTNRLTVHAGERRVELISVGPAHTRHDTVVWLPAERVLFAGDVVMPGCTPFVLMGTVRGMLAALDVLRALDPLVVVGGHGPVAGPEAFDETTAYLRWLQSVATTAAERGMSALQMARDCAREGYGGFDGLRDRERLVGNLRRALVERAGGELAQPLDVAAAFEEIVEFNGGRLPACHA